MQKNTAENKVNDIVDSVVNNATEVNPTVKKIIITARNVLLFGTAAFIVAGSVFLMLRGGSAVVEAASETAEALTA